MSQWEIFPLTSGDFGSDPSGIYVSIWWNAEQLLWNVSCLPLPSMSERVRGVHCPGDLECLKVNKKVHGWERNKGTETADFTYSSWESLLKSIRSSRHNCFGELSRVKKEKRRDSIWSRKGKGKKGNKTKLSLTGGWRMEENSEESWAQNWSRRMNTQLCLTFAS